MRARLAEFTLVALGATMLTVVVAMPVIQAPSTRVFGAPIVGVHQDPFVMMQVWAGPIIARTTLQPVTDLPGHWLAGVTGPVAAYNWLVLLSFPFAAVTAFALARHLHIPAGGAALAAIAFAFSPFHMAQAAYHPHVAQVQWVPLYVLALWHGLARGSRTSLVWWCAAAAAVGLSNFYAGFMAILLTPVIVMVRWPDARRLTRRVAAIGLLAGACVASVALATQAHLTAGAMTPVRTQEIADYSARALAYVAPPVAHPLVGAATMRMWHGAGVREELLEQQLTLGVGVLALAAVGIIAWARQWRHVPTAPPLRAVPALVVVAIAAAIISAWPSAVIASGLYDLAPMFRAYARFGVVVQLMAVLLAGIGLAVLWQRGAATPRWIAAILVALIAGEYAVAPAASSREIWPTSAHRWVHDHPTGLRVLDCSPFSDRTASDGWLTRGRVQLLGGPFADCAEPHLASKLGALGFTHLLVRAGAEDAAAYGAGAEPPGLEEVHRDVGASLWAVTAALPAIYIDTMTGLSPREHDRERSWRWMGAEAEWRLVNPGATTIVATLHLELAAFHHTRAITVRFDDQPPQHIAVHQERQVHVIGPLLVTPGHHGLTFHAETPPARPADLGPGADHRPLSIAFSGWRWTTVPQVF